MDCACSSERKFSARGKRIPGQMADRGHMREDRRSYMDMLNQIAAVDP
jgi:DNA-binding FrmR family transcriptional regulator